MAAVSINSYQDNVMLLFSCYHQDMDRIKELLKNDLEYIDLGLNSLIKNSSIIHCEINDFLKTPSKKIRSIVTLLYLKAHNKNINNTILDIILATEIIHNSSLLHDDVIDDAETRRKEPTLAKKTNSKISIIAGDLLLSKALEILCNINDDEITKKFIECAKEMCEAEIMQSSIKGTLPSLDDYIKICKGKTACLFKAVLYSVSKLADLDTKKACAFAEKFGILFQLSNDLDENSRQEDIKNGVHTIIDIIGIEKSKIFMDNYKEELKSIFKDFSENVYKKELEDLIKGL